MLWSPKARFKIETQAQIQKQWVEHYALSYSRWVLDFGSCLSLGSCQSCQLYMHCVDTYPHKAITNKQGGCMKSVGKSVHHAPPPPSLPPLPFQEWLPPPSPSKSYSLNIWFHGLVRKMVVTVESDNTSAKWHAVCTILQLSMLMLNVHCMYANCSGTPH